MPPAATPASVVEAPRRLVVAAGELHRLVSRTGLTLPPPFHPEPVDPEPVDGPGPDAAVHPSVAANLAVLAGGELFVHTEATVPGGRSRAVFAVAGPLGASLFALADGAVELSMFAAAGLGRELIRAVPEPDPDGVAARIRAAFSDGAPEPVRGRLPWAALAEFEPARGLSGRDGVRVALGLTEAEAELAGDLADRTEGVLRCLVLGRTGTAAGGGAGIGVGQVVWVCTESGWVGLDPQVAEGGERMVDLRPVARADLGTWLAPYLGQLLGGRDDRS